MTVRAQYLRAMGIDVWRRRTVPTAPPPEPAAQVAAAPATHTNEPAPSQGSLAAAGFHMAVFGELGILQAAASGDARQFVDDLATAVLGQRHRSTDWLPGMPLPSRLIVLGDVLAPELNSVTARIASPAATEVMASASAKRDLWLRIKDAGW